MFEADTGKFGNRNGQDREIDAGDAKAEGEKTDEGAGDRRDRHGNEQPKPWSDAEMHK